MHRFPKKRVLRNSYYFREQILTILIEGAKKHVAPSSDESASAEVEEKGLGGSEKEATKDKGKGKESVNKNAGGDPDFAI